MPYKIHELAALSGVTVRTLRYYDQIGLLCPARSADNGYRLYEAPQVDRLQQILFYRALGVSLEQIAVLLDAPDYDRTRTLEQHLTVLQKQREQLDLLIQNVTQTIRAIQEEIPMSDNQKFEGLKQLIEENNQTYGQEVIEKYGAKALEDTNRRLASMSKSQWEEQQALEQKMFSLLRQAMQIGDPCCEQAIQAADLHRQWLLYFWPAENYSAQAHRALAEGYIADPRFTAYYDKRLGAGATLFLKQAIDAYTL